MNNLPGLSGTVASLGKGKGSAVVVINGGSYDVPSEPYIVIADLTTPDLIPILVHAEAIVTDIGGLSSHAANISRELGIPCIVSTRYASKRINQGDFVEVDADNNLVKWFPRDSQCIFCSKHPTSRILKTQHFFAIYDGYPVRDGHLLIIPVRHINRIKELTQEEFCDLYIMMGKVDDLLVAQHEADGYNIGVNDGQAAGQTVPHLHFHVIPRREGDVPNPHGGIRNFLPNALTKYPLETE